MAIRDVYQVLRDDDISIVDNTTDSTFEYWGYAAPGTSSSDPSWKIIKWTKDSSGIFIQKQFANSSPAYKFVWDNRTSYQYG